MNRSTLTLTLIALAAGAAEPALPQAAAPAPDVRNTGMVDVFRVLGLPMKPEAGKFKTKSVAPEAVTRGLATARVYRFASADYPGASTSLVFDTNSSTVLGNYQFGSDDLAGFTFKGGQYKTVAIPGALGPPAVTSINTGGDITGGYVDFGGVTHGFVEKSGVVTTIGEPTGSTLPYSICDAGQIVGIHDTHGFSSTDNGASFTDFDVPTATFTGATGVNSAGVIVGQWNDMKGKSHGFILSGQTYTSLDFPLATSTTAFGVNDSNEVAGYYTDAAGMTHGFIYSAGAYISVDVTGARSTQLTRIKNNGHVTGAYVDESGESHGFTGH